jgi:hypothetical protein
MREQTGAETQGERPKVLRADGTPTSANTGPPPARPSAAPEKPARATGGAWERTCSPEER